MAWLDNYGTTSSKDPMDLAMESALRMRAFFYDGPHALTMRPGCVPLIIRESHLFWDKVCAFLYLTELCHLRTVSRFNLAILQPLFGVILRKLLRCRDTLETMARMRARPGVAATP